MTKKPDATMTLEWARELPLHDACISMANAYLTDKKSLDGALLARLAKRLIQAEQQPGGPYKNNNGIPDLPTNLAVGYFLACLNRPLPNVANFIKQQRKKEEISPAVRDLLRQYDTLLLNSGSRSKALKRPMDESYASAKQQLGQLDEPIRSLALSFLERLQKTDKNKEISLFPTYFSRSLESSHSSLPLTLLGEANIYCWIAYTIYDHLLDGDSVIEYLPVANVTMRLAIARYQSLFPSDHPFQEKILSTFTGMDSANSWEMKHCRFKKEGSAVIISTLPAYRQHDLLARRSLGHALGPLAIANHASYTAAQITSLEKGFRHYLIARQLSDDIHDWQEDMRAGHSSTVVTLILKNQHIKAGKYPFEPLITKMKSDFWHHSMEAANSLIHHHAHLSRQHFVSSRILKKDSELFGLVSRLDTIATQSSREHQRYKSFSSTYQELSRKTI